MDAKQKTREDDARRYESDFGTARTSAETLHFSHMNRGQSCPEHCACPAEEISAPERRPLGDPLTISDVARLLGCSPWTVRQRYLRQGLPYLQARPHGKLVFFREQVVAWITERQRHKKGEILR
ncbi:MAG TPA: helix-turn-helix domain-containing protein [Candidatus Sulfotelmatobacter sp.]